MPKLPTAENLGVKPFQDRSTVVRPTADTSGQDALVNSLNRVSDRMNERLDRSSLHKAKIHFQKAKLEADHAFDDDPDFETYQERYDKKLGEAMENAGKMVRNPRMREAFTEQLSLYRAEGNQGIKVKAFNRETDKALADLTESISIGRENYLRSTMPADKEFARSAIFDSIANAEESGYIDKLQAEKMRQKTAMDLAVASVEMEAPEKQLEILKSNKGLQNVIPLDMRTKMIDQAKSQLDSKVALDTANQIRQEGGARKDRLSKVNKIKDPDIKNAVRSQVVADLQQENIAEKETQFDIFDNAAKQLIEGKNLNEFRSTQPKQWDAMSAAQQSKLIKMANSKEKRETDLGFYHDLTMTYEKDPQQAYDMFLSEAHLLSEADAKSWVKRFAKGQDSDPLLGLDQEFNRRAGESGLKLGPKAKGKAFIRLQEEWDLFQENNPGKKPNAEQQKAMLDRVMGVYEDGFWSDTFNFEVDRDKVISRENQAKMEKFDAIVRQVEEEMSSDVPVELSDEQITLIYQDAVRRGLLDE